MSRTDAQIENLAVHLRTLLGLDDEFFIDFRIVFQRLPSVLLGFELVVQRNDPARRFEPFSDPKNKKIFVDERTFRDAIQGRARARMTLAHEIGHIVLGHSGLRFRHARLERIGKDPQVNREEGEAKKFAGYFLAPTSLAATCDSPETLAKAFGVSLQAAAVRFDQIRHTKQQSEPTRPLPAKVYN